MYDRCSVCKRYDFLDRHSCPPRWRVWIHGWHDTSASDDGRVIGAGNPEDAAREVVADCNDEGQFINADTLVMVMRERVGPEGERVWLTVTGEMVVQFHTRKAKEPKDYSPFTEEDEEVDHDEGEQG